jgi:quinol monooxygenase YgiN
MQHIAGIIYVSYTKNAEVSDELILVGIWKSQIYFTQHLKKPST